MRGQGSLVSRDPLAPLVKKATSHSPIIGVYGGYRKTLSFGYVCLIYHATALFCKRNYDYKNDALGKTTGQMIGAARSALVIINRATSLLHKQMLAIGETFAEEGGFTERLSKVRLEARDAKASANSPCCPECGGPMRKQVARKGRNAGNPFWSCCNYPNCHGIRKWEV